MTISIRLLVPGLLLLISTVTVFAQPAYDTIKWEMRIIGKDTIFFKKPSPADKAREEGNLAAAIPYYKQEMQELADAFLPYNLACAYALLGEKDSAFRYLDAGLKNDSLVYVLTDPDFYNLIGDARWKKIEDRQAKLYQAKNGKLKDLALAKELWNMKLKDQAYYYALEVAEKKHGPKSAAADSLWKLKKELNAANLKRLEEIIDKNGWPKISAVGRDAAGGAFLIVQHADLNVQKKYKPLLEEAANAKEADWSSLALLIDRIEVSENRPQIYGSQVKYNEEKKAYEPFPIIDEKNLDKRRRQAGLRPAKDYFSNWDIDYTVEQNTD